MRSYHRARILVRPIHRVVLEILLACLLASCGNSVTGNSTRTYCVGLTVSGLAGTGLVLQVTHASPGTVAITSNGVYPVVASLPTGTTYQVSVITQPTNPSQTCNISNASGVIASSNVTNILVNCSSATAVRFAYVETTAGIAAYSINSSSGTLSQVSGSPFASGTGGAYGALDPVAPYLYFANMSSGTISAFTYNSNNGTLTNVGNPYNSGAGVYSLAITPNGKYLYAANYNAASVSAFALGAGGSLTSVTGSPFATGSTGSLPSAVAMDPQGRFIYVANDADGTVSVFAIGSNGSLTPVAGSPFTDGGYGSVSLAVDPSGGHLYVVDYYTNSLMSFVITNTGSLTPLGASVSTGSNPRALTVNPTGNLLYVVNESNATISTFIISSTGTSLSTAAPVPTGNTPFDIKFDSSGQHLYVANKGDGTMSVYSVGSNGALTALPNSPYASGSGTTSMLITP